MWKSYKIRAGTEEKPGRVKYTHVETFDAPDLATAFGLARARWPFATQWESL